ncbi:hypothetical protein A244_10075 [Pseudomonas syringae pv. actinidiae ICMP 18807]|uniref:Uncharacterized protein n=1 Tax=Pseudomonas syringae pv. actinidiae ICMP 18807 TaxID=1194404 RepID=S6W3V7_PSESF|nr:hypothetical protein A244_10075 [Pseudomonas syringae pv. actinidiae ICMP 18807]
MDSVQAVHTLEVVKVRVHLLDGWRDVLTDANPQVPEFTGDHAHRIAFLAQLNSQHLLGHTTVKLAVQTRDSTFRAYINRVDRVVVEPTLGFDVVFDILQVLDALDLLRSILSTQNVGRRRGVAFDLVAVVRFTTRSSFIIGKRSGPGIFAWRAASSRVI